MAMDLNAASIFVKVVVTGSFTEASRVLGIPKSTVSEKVSDLERELGVTLLTRTTRKLKLTEVGAEFFKKSELGISHVLSAGEEASRSQMRPTGTLRITAPSDFTGLVIVEAVAEYGQKFPEVKVELDFSDREVDLVSEGYDIAIRAGSLDDSSLVAKRVGSGRHILVANAKYLQTAPPLKHPRELPLHKCIKLVSSESEDTGAWNLRTTQGKKIRVQPRPGLSSNSFAAIKNLVILGEGIALMPDTLCKKELSEKKMVQILPEWTTTESPMHLVYPPHRFSSPKVKEMIPLLERRLRELHT